MQNLKTGCAEQLGAGNGWLAADQTTKGVPKLVFCYRRLTHSSLFLLFCLTSIEALKKMQRNLEESWNEEVQRPQNHLHCLAILFFPFIAQITCNKQTNETIILSLQVFGASGFFI